MNSTGNLCTNSLLIFEILTVLLGAIAWLPLAIIVLRPRDRTVPPEHNTLEGGEYIKLHNLADVSKQ